MDRFVIVDFTLSVIVDNERKTLSCYLQNEDGLVTPTFESFSGMEYGLRKYFGFISDENI